MNKYLCAVIAVLVSILLAIAGWWVNRVNTAMEVVVQLQFQSHYLNGEVKAAPVQPPSREQVAEVLNAAAKK